LNKELETEVQDFETMKKLLLLLWLKIKAYQEIYRETWKTHDSIYFMLDEWPGLKTFIEIEWADNVLVHKYSEKLGFNLSEWIFWAVYQLYFLELWIEPKIINSTPEITF